MLITAKNDYAVRAVCCLANAAGQRVKAEALAREAAIPRQYLENIMGELRAAGIVHTWRGSEGGYELAIDPGRLDAASVLAAVGSPAVSEGTESTRESDDIADLWLALGATLREVLERVTVADLASATLPEDLRRLAAVELRRRRGSARLTEP